MGVASVLMAARRVVVTGLGLTTPLGVGVRKVWKRLLKGESGIINLPETQEYAGLPSQVVGRVPSGFGEGEFNEDLWVTPAERRTMALSSVYALCTAKEALEDAKLSTQQKYGPESHTTGVIIGSCMPDLQEIITAGNFVAEGRYRKVSPYFVPKILCNLPAGHVSMKFNLKGPNHTPSTACTTGLHAIGDAAAMIARGVCDVMVAGGTEACINPISIAGFCRAKALSTKFNSDPMKASRPFDSKRDGFVMSEGCGLVVIEELEHAINRNATIYAEILGYGLSGDAHHITAPQEDGEGACRSMSSALRDARLDCTSVGHINAHATSTPVGDIAENRAIKSLFGKHSKRLLISANKGALGHLLGAAGSVEAIFAILAVYKGISPPTINLFEKDAEFDLNYCDNGPQDWTDEKMRIAMANSFGFGGTNASLCIGEYNYV